MVLASIGTFVSMMKGFYPVYLNHNEDVQSSAKSVPRALVASLLVLVLLCILLGVYPNIALRFLEPIAAKLGSGLSGGGV